MKRLAFILGAFVVAVALSPITEAALQFSRRAMRLPPANLHAQAAVVPAGAILFVDTGACPNGYTEVAGAAGRMILATTDAAANVGGTGGSDAITPAGTADFTGNALGTHLHATGTYAASAHAGAAVADHASHTHTYTEVPNHVHLVEGFPTATGGSTGFTRDTSMSGTPANTAQNTANPTGGVATGTTAGPSATLTHSVTQPSAHTLSGSSEAVSAGTPAGTVSFTGTEFDNRSAFFRLIPCKKG
jgi:hypothetical protein